MNDSSEMYRVDILGSGYEILDRVFVRARTFREAFETVEKNFPEYASNDMEATTDI